MAYLRRVTPVRLAVIGAGAIGRRHVALMLEEPLCAVAAIADPAPAAEAFARERGLPYFRDAAGMLDATRPEGAIIATPNALHVPAGLACAQRAIPMLVEKPIADTLEGADTLVRAAARAGVALLVGHHRRHNPIIETARDLVQEGRLGRLAAVAALCAVLKPDGYFAEGPWRREPGGGPVLINLIHDIDSLRFICGEIAEVRALTANAVRGFGVEDAAAVALRFTGGALGTVTLSDAVAAPWSWEITSGENPFYPQRPESCYLFAGTEGSLAVPALALWHYPGERGWGAPLACDRIEVAAADPLVRQLRHFCRVVRGEAEPRITGPDATRTLAATLAVHRAAESGRPVAL